MTAHKHLKQLVRARMSKTGESYATARRQIIQSAPVQENTSREDTSQTHQSPMRWHMPGNVPAAAALRILLAHAGVRAPGGDGPISEAMAFGIAGGIGAGAISFRYEKEDFSSLYLAGRHLWQDDAAYLRDALARLGIEPVVAESSGGRTAESQLRELLAAHGPVIAWVDMVGLPHRAIPRQWSGSGYHLITIYCVDDTEAIIGDLADEPIPIPLDLLAAARGRIRKDRHRLLAISGDVRPPSMRDAVLDGLRACRDGLVRGRISTFTLASFESLARRMYGGKDKERWDIIFPNGQSMWRALTFLHDFIEHYGTGGGLCRPLFADFLREAAEAYDMPALAPVADLYAEIGRRWSELADAALPDDVPALREAKELLARKAELTLSGPPSEIRAVWERLDELRRESKERFPLSDDETLALRRKLQELTLALHAAEVDAHDALAAAIG